MTLKEIKDRFQTELKLLFPREEIDTFFFWIIEKEFGYSKSQTLAHSNETISMGESIMIHGCLNRLKKSEPIQYILGEAQFCGLQFKVTKATLIPRPETEELVNWIATDLKKGPSTSLDLLDLGTGTGCIAISLAKQFSTVKVTAMDVSLKALEIAKENTNFHKVSVDFILQDLLKTEGLPKKFDLMVSNPPYVRKSEARLMNENVLKYEPKEALFVDDTEPFVFYLRLAQLAKSHLKPQGVVYFEINEYLSKELIQALEKEGLKILELRQDFFGKDRMLKCRPQ